MAQTVAEYEAALAAITDGAQYRISTEVDGTKYYVTAGGTFTNVKAKGDAFTFAKITETSGDGPFVVEETTPAVGIQLSSSAGTRFTNAPLADNKAVLDVTNFQTSTNTRAPWESQVFFLQDGKYAIRTCNTIYEESGWKDAGRVFWTYAVAVPDVTPHYSYDPAYIWELEEYTETPDQISAIAKVRAWPAYVQGAVGLVKDPAKYYSNAKQTTEGSYEALLDNDYTSFFHSCWSNGPDEDHYLQAELSEATQKFEFYYKKRSQNNNNRPTKIIISAGNSADGEFTEVTTINSGLPTDASVIDYMSSQIDLGAAYKFVRFTITETNNNAENNGHKFFTFSEFYIFPGSDAAAQLAPLYNKYSSTLPGDLTTEEVALINSYDTALKDAISTVNVTYELYEADGTTLVDSKTVVQSPGSDIEIPSSLTSGAKFYDYSLIGEPVIGTTDCVIKIKRTLKAGFVGKLADLSNYKAYTITCDRGAMLTNGTTIASTSNSTYSESAPGQFAIINYESNYYLYSVTDKKFVANNGHLVEKPSNGVFDAIQMEAMTVPYFMYYFKINESTNYGVNTNGTGNLGGIVINSWMNDDAGNQYYMVEAADFDPEDAWEALDEQFHPQYSVIYKVKDASGKIMFTSDPEPAEQGAHITTLPEKYQRSFYTYDEIYVAVETTGGTEAVFTATWEGPFEISADFASAHWYDMAMRWQVTEGLDPYYVTSAVKDGEGAYKTQLANTMGLVEDSYQWAFVGDGYNGFQIFNKKEGAAKSFGWTDATATNGGIPTIMANEDGHHLWKVVKSGNGTVPSGSFCLNVEGTSLYINQYGGAGGSLKFWNSANNVNDPGSAFTVIEVPTNFAEYVVSEIAPAMDATGYFAFTEEAKIDMGYDESYKTDCTFETYKNLKENLAAAIGDINNFVLPPTGVYFLRNKNYSSKNYMGIDPSDANMYGDYAAPNQMKNYVTLIKTGDATYKISLMGKFAPVTVAQSTPVTASTEAGEYTVVITKPGYAAFQADTESNMSCLHRRAEGDIVGWTADADASMWALEDANSINLTVGETGYATAYLPFPVEIGKTLTVPSATGAWTFDDGTTGTLTATSGVTIADGVATVPAGNLEEDGATDYLAMSTGVDEISTYSIMFDVKAANVTKYCCLFNNDLTKDGSLFFNKGKLGLNCKGLGYNGEVVADTWYRVVFVSEDAYAYVYLNGVLVGQSVQGADEEHWKLGSQLYFFADDDGEEQNITVDELRFWNVALTADEVAMLGTYGTEIVAGGVAAYTGKIATKEGEDYRYIELVEVEDAIPALTGVVLKGDPGVYEFAIPQVVVDEEGDGLKIYDDEVDGGSALVKEEGIAEENVLKGTLEPIEAAGKYVLHPVDAETEGHGYPVAFCLADKGKIAAGKAYLDLEGAGDIKAFYFADEDATGIKAIDTEMTVDGAIYNVAGQRLSKMQKGINIMNGKKILK